MYHVKILKDQDDDQPNNTKLIDIAEATEVKEYEQTEYAVIGQQN